MDYNKIFDEYADTLGLDGNERVAAYQDFVDYFLFDDELMTFDTFKERMEIRRSTVEVCDIPPTDSWL